MLDTKSPTHQENEDIISKNHTENDAHNNVSNNIEENVDTPVHENDEIHTTEILVGLVNNKAKKKKSTKKSNKKAEKHKVALEKFL